MSTDSRRIAGVVALVGVFALGAAQLFGGDKTPEPTVLAAATAQVPEPAPAPAEAAPVLPQPGALPFPVEIRAEFELIDHFGNRVSHESYRGKPLLLFFGYANCESICTVALPRMGEALAHLGAEGEEISALMVTIDPDRDTPEAMRRLLPRWHDKLVGLTGSEEELAAVRDSFQVNREVVAEDPSGAPIYAHGGFIYFIGRDGEVKTMVPPILAPERMAELAQKYFGS
ncbi:MAG: SCO family protein [Pseudomonadota bacterium]